MSKRYELTEKLKTGLYGLTGTIAGVEYFQKPWTELTQKELKNYYDNTHENTRNNHVLVIEVKEKKDGKAKAQKIEDTPIVEQDTEEPSK